jgi:hypothetical protein
MEEDCRQPKRPALKDWTMFKRRAQLVFLIALLAFPMVSAGPVQAAGGGGAKTTGPTTPYVRMRALNVNILRSSGARTVVTFEVGIFVTDPNLLKRTDASIPRLQAAFGQIVQGYMVGLPTGTIPNADYLAQMLQKETDRVVGQKGAKLLLGTIIIN